MNKTVCLSLLLLAPGLALAASDPNEAVRSIIDIFGLDPRSLDSIIHGTNAPGIIAAVSNVINSAALSAAVALMIWTTITMTANTAHEGNLGGEKYSNLWIPLRSAFSLALVLPIAKGYSLVQIMILLLAMLGFKFADMTWDAVLKHFQNTGPIVNISPPDTDQLAVALYKSHTCMLRLNTMLYKGKRPKKAAIRTQAMITADGTRTYVYSFDGMPNMDIREGGCGKYIISHPASPISDYMHQKSVQYFNTLSSRLNEAAYKFVSKPPAATAQQTADAITQVTRLYNRAIREAAAQAIQQGEGEVNKANKAFYEEARDAGWVMAGAWFWTMAGINRQIADTIKNQPSYTLIDISTTSQFWQVGIENEMRRISGAVIPKMRKAPNTSSAGVAGMGSADLGEPVGWLEIVTLSDPRAAIARMTKEYFYPFIDTVSNFLLEDGHAEAKLQSLGHWIIAATESYFVAALIARATADGAAGAKESSLARFIPGLGESSGFTVRFAQRLIHDVVNVLSAFAIALLLLGLLLAFYFPAIAFINWFSAVIGWLVMLLEAVFAAPFWAAAHAVPEGEGIAGQHGKAGWMLVLSLIARPVLMIAGLVGAMLLLHYGSELLLLMFAPFAKGMNADSISGLFSMLAVLALLVVVVLILAKTAFSLIYVIPDRTLAWIGQGAANLGETQMGEESKTMIMAAGQGGDKVAKEVANMLLGKKEGGQGQGKQGTANSSDKTQSTSSNNAEEEVHAAGNMLAKGEAQQEQDHAGKMSQHSRRHDNDRHA